MHNWMTLIAFSAAVTVPMVVVTLRKPLIRNT